MIVWPAKDPDEVLDYSWTPPLDDGDTIASYTATRSSGTATIDSDENSDTAVTVWLGGGTDGETDTFSLTATTTGGRTFREVAVLPVFDRASDLLALFRLRYGAFSTLDDATIGYWLGDAAKLITESWTEADRDPAKLALAAHMLSESGALSSGIPEGVTSFRSGSFSATFSDSAASRTGLLTTVYGREFLNLRRRSFIGPMSAWTPTASDGCGA